MNTEKISKLIKEKRKEKGYTQEELASKINVTEKAISRWETGRGTPDISLLIPLSSSLGISVSELLNGEKNKDEEDNIKEIINYIDNTNKKKNKFIIPIYIIIYIILLILYLLYLKTEYSKTTFNFDYLGELFIFIFFAFMSSLNNSLLSNYYYDKLEDKARTKKITYIISLILYIIMIINLTTFGRWNYGVNSYNLIPFKTLISYITFFDSRVFMINVIGNIFILMPVEYLIIKIFNVKKISINILVGLLIGISIELFQYITTYGVFDIDDIILYLVGIIIMYYVYDILFNKKKIVINKKHIIIAFISQFILFTSFEMLSWYSFGDIPSILVFIRLIVCFIIIYYCILKVYNYFSRFYN